VISLKTFISIDPLHIDRVTPDSFQDGFIFRGVIHNFGFIKLTGGLFIKKNRKLSCWAFSWGSAEVWIYYPNPTEPIMTRSQGFSVLASNLDFIWQHTDDPQLVLEPQFERVTTHESFDYQQIELEIDRKDIPRGEAFSLRLNSFYVDQRQFEALPCSFRPKTRNFYPNYVRQKHDQTK
jgi:hypothetical protein